MQRARIDALAGECSAVLAGPVDAFVRADVEQQVELLREQGVIILELQAEQRERLDERAAADHELGAAAGKQIQRGKLLEDPHGVRGTQDRDGAG